MATIAKYKVYNGTSWEEYYFTTSADAVIETSSRKFLAASEKTAITALAALSGTGFVKKTSSGWSIDTSTYLTSSSNLDATKLVGKVPISSIPDSLIGQVSYKGTFNANTDGSIDTPQKGWYYICEVAGNYNPDGTTSSKHYDVGDWAIYNGTAWDKVDNTDAIASWCGLTGVITTAQAKTALGGSVAEGSDGFVLGSDVYTALLARASVYAPTFFNKIRVQDTYQAYEYADLSYYAAPSGGNPTNNGLVITAGTTSSNYGGNIYLNPVVGNGSSNGGKVYYNQDISQTLDADKEIATKGDVKGFVKMVGTSKLDSYEIPTGYPDGSGLLYKSRLYYGNSYLYEIYNNAYQEIGLKGPRVYLTTTSSGGKAYYLKNKSSIDADATDEIAIKGDVPTVTKSSTAPTGAKAGDIWFDTSN